MKVNIGKVLAGGCAAALIAVLGVVAVQAREVSSCWSDFEPLADGKVFPLAYPVQSLDSYHDPALDAAQSDAGFRAGTAFEGDTAVGAPVWTIPAQGPSPTLADQFGLLTARGGAAPADLAMYEGRNGKRHWMRTANKPVVFFMKNLRALTFTPRPGGSTHLLGADARSGYLQWCRAVPLAPAGAAAGGADEDGGWATGRTGNGRTVLLIGKAKGGTAGSSAIAFQDVVTGKTARAWSVAGEWTDAASDGKHTYAAAPGAVAAYRPGGAAPLWQVELPHGAGGSAASVQFTAVQDGLVLVGSRQPDGRGGALTAFEATTGRQVWTLPGADPGDALVAAGQVLVREERAGRAGVAAYRLTDGTPVWFTEVGGLRKLADGAADGAAEDGSDAMLLYLPGERGPRVLRIVDGSTMPTTLATPVDRIFVSGQRIVVRNTASSTLSWTIAYLTPKATADKTAPEPRRP